MQRPAAPRPHDQYEEVLAAARRRAGVGEDRELSAAALRDIAHRFQQLYAAHTGESFRQDPFAQLLLAVRAVFDSWGRVRSSTGGSTTSRMTGAPL